MSKYLPASKPLRVRTVHRVVGQPYGLAGPEVRLNVTYLRSNGAEQRTTLLLDTQEEALAVAPGFLMIGV